MDIEKVKLKIKENNEKISSLLKQNENLLRAEGLNVPEENFAVEGEEKINIPSGYIRVTTYFINKYHLNDIVKSKTVKDNIAYAFQITDFYNYIINRFYIWGSVATMLYKNAIITFVSIMEAFVSEYVKIFAIGHMIVLEQKNAIFISTREKGEIKLLRH